jgi:hypothetical protein
LWLWNSRAVKKLHQEDLGKSMNIVKHFTREVK